MAYGDGLMLGQNLRYLLWKKGLSSDKWVERVAAVTGIAATEVVPLLSAGTAPFHVLESLSDEFGVSQEELRYEDLLGNSHIHLFGENLEYLLEGEGGGKKRRLADAIGVNVNTISAWVSGRVKPREARLTALCEYFQLHRGSDLLTDPLFLSLDPVSGHQQKEWLKRQIDTLSSGQLADLYPALKKLLSA